VNEKALQILEQYDIRLCRSFGGRGAIMLETEQGLLTIEGDNLHISRLTLEKGEVDIEGQMESFVYSDAGKHGRQGESLMARLFK